MVAFDDAFAHTIGLEGGYAFNPADPGGETMYGVTARVARAWGYQGAMRALPLAVAKQIAKAKYWDILMNDQIAALAPTVAAEMFDTAYNCGAGTAAGFLRRALNKFNRQGRDYSDTDEGGTVDPLVIAALGMFIIRRGTQGAKVLTTALNCLQGAYYMNIADKRPGLEDFMYGWFVNRVNV